MLTQTAGAISVSTTRMIGTRMWPTMTITSIGGEIIGAVMMQSCRNAGNVGDLQDRRGTCGLRRRPDSGAKSAPQRLGGCKEPAWSLLDSFSGVTEILIKIPLRGAPYVLGLIPFAIGSSSAGNSEIRRQPLSVTTTSSSMRAAEKPSVAGQ